MSNVQTSVNQKRLLHNRGTETEAYTISAVLSLLQRVIHYIIHLEGGITAGLSQNPQN